MTVQPKSLKAKASFRDPAGFIFFRQGQPYRQINASAKDDFEYLYESGLYDQLVENGYLIDHILVDKKFIVTAEGYRVVAPQKIPFISYPYEWCFSQLREAALLTLRLQLLALEKDMALKDASAYNIQFLGTKPIHIDILSFERYQDGEPWVAYRQFCQHFLAPLALMARTDIRLNQLLRVYLDGIPLNLAVKLLPVSARTNLGLVGHLYLHAKSQTFYSDKKVKLAKYRLEKPALISLIRSLEQTVEGLKPSLTKSEWSDYYSATNYTNASLDHKKSLVGSYIRLCKPKILWDLGANTGQFSSLASLIGIYTVAFDVDPLAVEAGFVKHPFGTNLLPLVLDLTNPSGGIGWANEERQSLAQRGPADTVMALALVHHLAISNNLPLEMIAEYFAALGKNLIIEFIPKTDSQVERLLGTRKDIFPDYHQKGFEAAFAGRFSLIKQAAILGSKRTLYLMKRK